MTDRAVVDMIGLFRPRHMSDERLRGVLYIVISASAFGAMAILARFAAEGGADVAAVLFLRFALAGAVMAAFMHFTRRRWPRGRQLAALFGMGGVGYVGQSMCFFSALNYASAGMVALLLYLHPFIVTLLAAMLFGHRLGRVRIVCVLLAIAGAALTIGGDLHSQPLGIALGVASALIYSGYLLIGSRVLDTEDPLSVAATVMLSAALVLAVVVGLARPAFPATLASWLSVIAIALLSTVVAMGFLFAGMRLLGPADAATLSTLEPVVTFALAALLLDEAISAQQLFGVAVVIGAVVWLARAGGGADKRAETPD